MNVLQRRTRRVCNCLFLPLERRNGANVLTRFAFVFIYSSGLHLMFDPVESLRLRLDLNCQGSFLVCRYCDGLLFLTISAANVRARFMDNAALSSSSLPSCVVGEYE